MSNQSNQTNTVTEPGAEQLHALLGRVQGRLRMREAASRVPTALSLGLAASLVLAVLSRFMSRLSPVAVLEAAPVLLLSAVLVVIAHALFRPRDLMSTARRADLLLSLDERLSTALEDTGRVPADPTPALLALREAQLEDALSTASRVDLRKDLPLRVPARAFLQPGVALLVVLLALFAPVPGLGPTEAQRAVASQVSAERKDIEELKKAVQSQPNTANDPAKQALNKELDDLLRDLQSDGLTREEALARLSQAETNLEKQLDPQAPAKREALDELAKQLSDSKSSAAKEAGDALKAGDTQKAADALKRAADNSAAMTAEQRKQLADTLKQAQGKVAPLDPELAQRLNEAANALQSNDPKAAQDATKNLAQNIQQTGQDLATRQQIEQSLAQIQQSKSNIAQAGQPTPSAAAMATAAAQAAAQSTASANGTAVSGTSTGGTPLSGTAVASLGTPVVPSGTPASGTPVALGSPVKGQISGTGTPVVVQGTPGQGTPVAAAGQGQGQGQGQQSGQQGQGQQGTGQQGQGQGQSQGQANGQQGSNTTGQPGSSWGKGHTDPVYVPPSSVNAPSTVVPVQGQNSPGGEQSSATTNTDANNVGASQVPYDQVYGQYSQQAGNALNSDYIPQGYKDLVKDYFSSIEPSKK